MTRVSQAYKGYEKVIADSVADDLQRDGWSVWRDFNLVGETPRRRYEVDIFARRGEEIQVIEIRNPGSNDQSVIQRFEAIKAAFPEAQNWTFRIVHGDEVDSAKASVINALFEKLGDRMKLVLDIDASPDEYALAVVMSSKLAEDVLRALMPSTSETYVPFTRLIRHAGEGRVLSPQLCNELLRLTGLRNSILHGDGFLTSGLEQARFADLVIKKLMNVYNSRTQS